MEGGGVGVGHVVDPRGIGGGRALFGQHHQHVFMPLVQQHGAFDEGVFQAVVVHGNGNGFSGFAAYDRPLRGDGVVHRQTKRGG
ncbi:hypothetical protein D3C71_2022010 [compost metagenome]